MIKTVTTKKDETMATTKMMIMTMTTTMRVVNWRKNREKRGRTTRRTPRSKKELEDKMEKVWICERKRRVVKRRTRKLHGKRIETRFLSSCPDTVMCLCFKNFILNGKLPIQTQVTIKIIALCGYSPSTERTGR